MNIQSVLLWLLACIIMHQPLNAAKKHRAKVGLCITATGRYDQFIPPLIESARKHFCKKQKVTYFIFTDGNIPVGKDIVRIQQHRLGWPYDTMMRPKMYYTNRKALRLMDYLFTTDADMLFVASVGKRILAKRVATQHPGFVNKRGSYESNPLSLAYVAPHEGTTYFAGGFWGGTRKQFLKACKIISRRIEDDLNRQVMPVWHDESHVNRYFIDYKPTKILDPSYCYPEELILPFKKRLLALCKNHAELRK